MKIDYNIIWVDDKIDTRPFKGVIKKIDEFLSEQFFNVTIVTAEDFEEFKEKYNEDIDYDLVITDLNLNNSKGNDVIDFVRLEKNILTEVFFYSANSEVNNTGLANSSRITFFRLDDHNSYNSLQNKLEEVISLTIAKFQHIVAMRGMIMHETSSLDLQMEYIVKTQLKNPDLKDSIDPLLNNIFDSIFANAEEKYNKAKKRKAKDILRDNILFNSSQKIYALGEILNIMKEDNFSESYSEEIILIRNQFAHSELIKDDNGNEFFKVKGKEIYFDKDLCKIIRKNIIKHKGNLEKLNSL